MKYRDLGKTGEKVSSIGLGCMSMSSVYGETDDQESLKLLDRAAAQLALAWVLTQGKHVVPIPGTKKIKNLEDNAGSVDVEVTAEDMAKINSLLEKYPNIGPRYSANENKFVKKQ